MPSDKGLVRVIDDDEAVRQSLAFLLGTAGIDVQTYDSATAFLGVAPKVKAGCVITDVGMPGLSGIDLLHRLREAQACSAGDRHHGSRRCSARRRSDEDRRH